jgi:hypothetical protein
MMRPWRRKKVTLLAAVAVGVTVAAVLTWLALFDFRSGDQAGPAKAAIVDQLSLTFPNPAFVENATRKLELAGYAVDYIPGEEVTVEFYHRLPSRGYDLVVLRVHSDRIEGVWRGEEIDETVLFTSQKYDATKYYEDRGAGRLTRARYYEGGEAYFGIAADFVEETLMARLSS